MSNLKQISKIIRKDTIKIIHNTNTAHLGSCLSCIDILTVIYFTKLIFKKT